MIEKQEPLSIALPKGRLFEQVQEHFSERGIKFNFEKRKLIAVDQSNSYKFYLVKNSDLPIYVHHGIAGLGICGDDVIYESEREFFRLLDFDFGGTRLSLAGPTDAPWPSDSDNIAIATSYTTMVRDHFHSKGMPVDIIKLKGSVELAPALGLSQYIVDLVETGSTLKANGLEVKEDLFNVKVRMVSNKAYYKLNYHRISKLLNILKGA
jgi:ATP phosphoribosyltransferase